MLLSWVMYNVLIFVYSFVKIVCQYTCHDWSYAANASSFIWTRSWIHWEFPGWLIELMTSFVWPLSATVIVRWSHMDGMLKWLRTGLRGRWNGEERSVQQQTQTDRQARRRLRGRYTDRKREMLCWSSCSYSRICWDGNFFFYSSSTDKAILKYAIMCGYVFG